MTVKGLISFSLTAEKNISVDIRFIIASIEYVWWAGKRLEYLKCHVGLALKFWTWKLITC